MGTWTLAPKLQGVKSFRALGLGLRDSDRVKVQGLGFEV